MFKEENFEKRLKLSIHMAWNIFIRKVGNGLIEINKEASMQLHYAYILQSIIPLIVFKKDESIRVELEQTVKFSDNSTNEIDLLLIGKKGECEHRIAVEMKCYRKLASSGSRRGAIDIFCKDIYVDLEILEKYINDNKCNETVFLCMHDMKRLVYPDKKEGKYWNYDISQGFTFKAPGKITTPVGGKAQNITLTKNYKFDWENLGVFYFLEM